MATRTYTVTTRNSFRIRNPCPRCGKPITLGQQITSILNGTHSVQRHTKCYNELYI